MPSATVAYIAGAFILGFILGRRPGATADIHPIRGGWVFALGAVLAVFTFAMAGGARYWSGVGVTIMFLIATALTFSGGLGLLLGSLSVRYTTPGRARWIAGTLAFFAPLAALGWASLSVANTARAAEEAKAARIAAFQMTTVEGTFAAYPINLPVSPQIEAAYECKRQDSNGIFTCRSHFAFHDGNRLPADGQAVFKKLQFWAKGDACEGQCLDLQAQTQWCQRRPDFADTVFCDTAPVAKIVFGTEPTLEEWHHNFDQWDQRDTGDEGLRLYCLPPEHKRPCQALFEPAPGIFATAWLPAAPDPDLIEQAREMRAYGLEIWTTLTTPALR